MNNLATLSHPVLFVTTLVWLASCIPDDQGRCGEGFRFDDNNCIKLENKVPSNGKSEDAGSDGNTDGDTIDKRNWIGSACSCEGDGCRIAGVPTEHRGTAVGCDEVPKDQPGALLGCLQSYEGDITYNFYYAQGFCTLLSVGDCSGDENICLAIPAGDFEAMVSCPKNAVLITLRRELSSQGLHAEFSTKYCAPACDQDADCRVEAFDDFLNEPGRYQCIDKDGVKFCYDPRNLNADQVVDYDAEAF